MGLKAALAATAGFIALSSSAFADWQYVRWGMTAAQVIAASKGEIRASSSDPNAKCLFVDQTPIGFGPTKKIGEFDFTVIVCGSGGKATSVALRGKQGNYNSLRAALLAQYGQPIQDGRGDMAITVWRDQKRKNLVRLVRVLDGGSIEYRAAPAASGL